MFDILKTMQQQGVFQILSSDNDLNSIILNAKDCSKIKNNCVYQLSGYLNEEEMVIVKNIEFIM